MRPVVEVILIVAAACGLLGCFGSVARVDVGRKRRAVRPMSRAYVR